MSKAKHYELAVDMPRCDAFGYCAELLPEIIDRDEWGYPIVTGEITHSRLDEARRAVVTCPKLALRLAATNGRQITGRTAASVAIVDS
jgi:ferredoxin